MMRFLFFFVVIIIVLLLLKRNRQHTETPPVSEKMVEVSCDNQIICVRYPDGELQNIEWTSLHAVTIRTTDKGPFSPDIFWELYTTNEKPFATFPGGAAGESELLQVMQDRLPGFDNEQVINAMASTKNRIFKVWVKQR